MSIVPSLLNLFDAYTIRARIYPVIPILLPVYSVFLLGAGDESDLVLLSLVASPFIVFALSQLVGEQGRALQSKMKLRPEEDEVIASPEKYRLSKTQVKAFMSRNNGKDQIRHAINKYGDDPVVFDKLCVYGFRRNLMAIRILCVGSNAIGVSVIASQSYVGDLEVFDSLCIAVLCVVVTIMACSQGDEHAVRRSARDYISALVYRTIYLEEEADMVPTS